MPGLPHGSPDEREGLGRVVPVKVCQDREERDCIGGIREALEAV
jgi:hypothetical protein